ncbi:MAG: hypothetical protein JO270_07970 [Acidobacteriaceae bacterium]|nr:hypothetical protein [Acidobacteriaceae bacterium]MBV8568982.1 hypothetical protein [Acidobacteriaceae bacterium]
MTGELENGDERLELRDVETAIHNLRNPVSSIWSAVEYLMEDAAETLTQEQLRLLRGIEESSALMLQIIDGIVKKGRLGSKPAVSSDAT